jgi:alkylation response protein AidB-like acyl-CoA dehydrogenase
VSDESRAGASDEVNALRTAVAQFCAAEVNERARAWDEEATLPVGLVPRLGELGLLGATVSEDDGGVGTTWVGAAAIVEALAQGSGSLAAIVAAHEALGVAPLLALASVEQRERLLPRWVTGELATGLLRADVEASREAGQWCLSGRASDVIGGATASKLVVIATIDGEPTAFLVETDAGGVVRKRPALLGLRAAGVADIELVSVRVDDEMRIGAVGAAAEVAQAAEDRVRVLFAAIACGLGRAALSSAIVYAKEREQFGQPIAQFQAIQWKLADAATGLDAAALLVHEAAARLDRGRPASIAAARALVFAGTQAAKAAHDALQVHGGYGYVRDFPVERHLRDARAAQVLVSAPAVLRTIVADGIAARHE